MRNAGIRIIHNNRRGISSTWIKPSLIFFSKSAQTLRERRLIISSLNCLFSALNALVMAFEILLKSNSLTLPSLFITLYIFNPPNLFYVKIRKKTCLHYIRNMKICQIKIQYILKKIFKTQYIVV